MEGEGVQSTHGKGQTLPAPVRCEITGCDLKPLELMVVHSCAVAHNPEDNTTTYGAAGATRNSTARPTGPFAQGDQGCGEQCDEN